MAEHACAAERQAPPRPVTLGPERPVTLGPDGKPIKPGTAPTIVSQMSGTVIGPHGTLIISGTVAAIGGQPIGTAPPKDDRRQRVRLRNKKLGRGHWRLIANQCVRRQAYANAARHLEDRWTRIAPLQAYAKTLARLPRELDAMRDAKKVWTYMANGEEAQFSLGPGRLKSLSQSELIQQIRSAYGRPSPSTRSMRVTFIGWHQHKTGERCTWRQDDPMPCRSDCRVTVGWEGSMWQVTFLLPTWEWYRRCWLSWAVSVVRTQCLAALAGLSVAADARRDGDLARLSEAQFLAALDELRC